MVHKSFMKIFKKTKQDNFKKNKIDLISNCIFMDSHVFLYKTRQNKIRAKNINAIRYEKEFSMFIDYFRRSLSIISPSMVIFLIITFIGQLKYVSIDSIINVQKTSAIVSALFLCFLLYILYRDGFCSKPRPKVLRVKVFHAISSVFFMVIIGLVMTVGVINGSKLKADLFPENASNEKKQQIENILILEIKIQYFENTKIKKVNYND